MPPGHDASALMAGLALGASYLVSIGPNKMAIIREALMRGRTGLVASTVLGSYLVLLVLSYLLADRCLAGAPALRLILSWIGVASMSWFAVKALRAAREPRHRSLGLADTRESLGACVRRVLGIAGVNPLMYIELFFIPTTVSGTFATATLRLQFTFGLAIMSALACYGYAALAHACSHLLRHQRTLQAFDVLCGLLLASIAASLGLRLWFQPV